MGMCRCPYNDVASFIYRYKGNRDNKDVKILELGSGDGNNLWYLKKENFNVSGIELDEERIKLAKKRLKDDNLSVNIINNSFVDYDYKENEFDLIFDRAAVTCVNYDDAKRTIQKVNKALKRGGYFYFNPYSELDNNMLNGEFLSDGRVGKHKNILKNYEGINFYSIKELLNMFNKDKWEIIEINLLTKKEIIKSRDLNISTFEVVVKKI